LAKSRGLVITDSVRGGNAGEVLNQLLVGSRLGGHSFSKRDG
jgi:hypothetical protein